MNSIDTYREATQTRLNNSLIYKKLVGNNKRADDHGSAALVTLVNEGVEYCYQRSKLVVRHMGEYTLHDGEHLFRVLHFMELLIPERSLNQLSNPELALLILTAFFHDIGMSPSEDEVNNWKGAWKDGSPTAQDLVEHQNFVHFRAGQTLKLAEIALLNQQGRIHQAATLESYIISDYIRMTHAKRAIDILQAEWVDRIKYKDFDLAYILATLCNSHNDNILKLRELDSSVVAGNNVFICLPFLGVILRLADILDFDGNRTPKVLFAHLGVKNPISIGEWQKHRAVEAWSMPSIPGEKITFTAICTHPAIEATVLQFCDDIDRELSDCTSVLANLHDSVRRPFPEYYKVPLPGSVERSKIGAKKDLYGEPLYLYRDTKFTLNKAQVIDILMGTKLYGQPSAALRELVQNSIDTCKLRNRMEESWGNTSYKPSIHIRFIKEGNTSYLEVDDNGVGMDQDIIDKFYSKVGTSYYKSSDFTALNSGLDRAFIPTSRFGIGVLSYFMITDSIEVQTKRILGAHNSAPALHLSIVGQESIFYTRKSNKAEPGTLTRLELKQGNFWAHMPGQDLLKHIKETVPFPPFDIRIHAYGVDYIHSPITISDIAFDSQQEESWFNHDHIAQRFRVDLDGSQGIEGSCMVALLESNGMPHNEIILLPKVVTVDGKDLFMSKKYFIEINRFLKSAHEIDIDPNSNLAQLRENNTSIMESRSEIALHGVAIPTSIFAQWSGQIYMQAIARWPISVLIKINIISPLDINLNSARTQILIDDKWRIFENALLNLILKDIRGKVSQAYWSEFKHVINSYARYQVANYSSFASVMNAIA